MKTPIQQLKENYYKMSESEFHYWMSQNIETLLEKERNMVAGAYNRDVIDGIQDWFVRSGIHYYELHYEGTSRVNEYKSDKEDQVGESGRGNKTTDEEYSFEAGV